MDNLRRFLQLQSWRREGERSCTTATESQIDGEKREGGHAERRRSYKRRRENLGRILKASKSRAIRTGPRMGVILMGIPLRPFSHCPHYEGQMRCDASLDPQQRLHFKVTLGLRPVQCRASVTVLRCHVSPGPEQQRGDLGMSKGGSDHQWAIAVLLRLIDVGLVLKQELRRIAVAHLGGDVERSSTNALPQVDVGLLLQQELRNVSMAVLGREEKWRSAVVAAGLVDLGLVQQQQLHSILVAFFTGNVKSRTTVALPLAALGLVLQKKLRSFPVTVLRGDEKWSGAIVHALVDIRLVAQKELRSFSVAIFRGDEKRSDAFGVLLVDVGLVLEQESCSFSVTIFCAGQKRKPARILCIVDVCAMAKKLGCSRSMPVQSCKENRCLPL
eukprot:RCo019736